MNYWTQSNKNIYVAAHRGWQDKYPENTMAAFKAAIDLGVDQIETDVRVTKDNKLVLIHDSTVDRTTNGTGKVSSFTYDDLCKLDAGNGEKIPLLTDLMELVKDHPTITLDLELKEYPEQVNKDLAFSVCDRVLKIVDDYNFTDRIVINSFSGGLNEYIYKKYGKKYRQHGFYPIRHLINCSIDPYSYLYCACVFGIESDVTYSDVHKLYNETGVRIWAGASVKDEESLEKAIKMGAELITCNNPDEILRLLHKKGLHK